MKLKALFLLAFSGVSHQVAANAIPCNDSTDASTLLESIIDSIGGSNALKSVHRLVYKAEGIYRSQTLTQNYNLYHSDQSVAETGSETLSFDLSSGLRARIDRYYRYNDYWIWAQPGLEPSMNYSIVLKDGADGFACFTKGQNSFFVNDPTQTLGYVDSYLADYLIHQAQQFALPCLIVNATSHRPYKIRSLENHATYGKSTNDLLLSNYSTVSFDDNSRLKLQLPYRLQTIYNSTDVLEDVKLDSISVNPLIKAGFFDPVLPSKDTSSPQVPKQSALYPRSEVHEFFEAGLWGGPFESFFNTSHVVVTHPIPNIPQIMAVYVGYADYVQLVLNFTDGVLITDAAPHRSRILIQWVKETLNKSVTHIVPSHHHRDHAGGVPDYVEAGAVLVVPEVAKRFYSDINNGSVSFATYNEKNPFVLKDANIQFRSLWRDENPHARDWSYGIATSACPEKNEGVVAFVADVWSPDPDDGGMGDAVRFDIGYARQWLDAAVGDGLPRDTVVVGAHGGNTTIDKLESLITITGYEYPNLETKDWKTGGALCKHH
ncbi:uncharacterized protein TRIVIDRAFT_163307 [Trichoderma virens Gv29-8]|uniref:Metallo-beta-lactamase domain-containing protein n=1 Tax=Hypocrea virens (strain Gv29-8 / FGSC 10586) TaxID=413071 RepID=G9NBI5_HYPVG|nr:uncharacterized protein TRIVIDRAFT_163307 [Trichoderma virens Gv29-8]EHK16190.1 hypothetical protein TRIVIDRAFT_163307 [Trichoderma virens Gv29-8]UKZ56034.1 hypothetical protein TrVGV298_009859 [Trichoderma virens]